MKTTDKIKSYGRLNTATIRACAKNKALAKAMILAYIDQRANLPWVFCICNIVNETGITEKTVRHYIKELQAEGVLLKVPVSQYKGQMRSNMTYYSLDKAAYETTYWTVEEQEPNEQTANETLADDSVVDKGGNEYLEKGVAIPEKGGNHSGKVGTGYREKGVTATPYIEEKKKMKNKMEKKERKTERKDALPLCLPPFLLHALTKSLRSLSILSASL